MLVHGVASDQCSCKQKISYLGPLVFYRNYSYRRSFVTFIPCLAGCVITTQYGCRFQQATTQDGDALGQLGPSPKIVHVMSLASSHNLKFSPRFTSFMNSQRAQFFYQLALPQQLALLKILKHSTTGRTDYRKLAQMLNLPIVKVTGWFGAMKLESKRLCSTIEEVPHVKIRCLHDEFFLSETLTYDRLLMLSHVLKIQPSVIEKFFSLKRHAENCAPAP